MEQQIQQLMTDFEAMKEHLNNIEKDLENLKERTTIISRVDGHLLAALGEDVEELYYRVSDIQTYELW
jgi:hypothetical protein